MRGPTGSAGLVSGGGGALPRRTHPGRQVVQGALAEALSRHLRGRLPRVLLRLPAGAEPAPAWRLMHAPLAEQHRWYASILRGHYGYFGMPHNWRSLDGFRQEIRRIWFNCLRRRSQKNRRMGWDWFEALTACLPLPTASDHPPLDTTSGPMRVTSGKSRVRESRLPGSVRAKPNGRATRPRPTVPFTSMLDEPSRGSDRHR